MKIIGHRGAAKLALENTIAGITAAKKAGVDAIEFDIRLTADGIFVLSHDQTLARVSDQQHIIKENTLAELRKIALNNGEKIATLDDALKAAGSTPVVIEVKGTGWAERLTEYLDTQKPIDAVVIAFNHGELRKFVKLSPAIPTYAIERHNAFEAIQLAKQSGFTGVDFNFWLLNPLTYWIARRKGLKIIVYTVNIRWIAALLRLLFPGISITTDRPDIMQFLRKRPTR